MLTLVFAACHKDEKHTPDKPEPIIEDTVKQYSYWVVNEDSFKTNHVSADIGKARMDLYAEGFENRFGIGFNFGYELPRNGSFIIAHDDTNNPNYVHVGFYYHDSLYVISPNTNNSIIASSVNGKAQYTLSPTWFVDYYDHSDSVLISGTFNEP